MIKFIRLFIVSAFLLVGLSPSARADYAAIPYHFNCNSSGHIFDDQQTACQYISSANSNPLPYAGGAQAADAYQTANPGPYSCHVYWTLAKTDTPSVTSCTASYSCPYGGTVSGPSTLNGQKYTCTGTAATGPGPVCTAGKSEKIWSYTNIGTGPNANNAIVPGMPVSDGVCGVVVDYEGACVTLDSTGEKGCEFTVHQTGSPLAVDPNWMQPSADPPSGSSKPAPQPLVSASSCPGGSVQAGVDSSGTPICMGTGVLPSPVTDKSVSTSPANTVTNSDGSTTTTQVVSTRNPDGSVTSVTKTTTTGTDGTVTVSYSGSSAIGAGGATGIPGNGVSGDPSAAAPAPDFCAAHPTLTVCLQASVSQACSNGVSSVTCTGDAVQCAGFQQLAAIRCQQAKDAADLAASPSKALGDQALAGNDPAASTFPTKANAANVVMPSSLDNQGWLGGGQFFQDKTVTFQKWTITLPFSKYGQYVVVMRYALMIIALLVSFKILSGAILRE